MYFCVKLYSLFRSLCHWFLQISVKTFVSYTHILRPIKEDQVIIMTYTYNKTFYLILFQNLH